MRQQVNARVLLVFDADAELDRADYIVAIKSQLDRLKWREGQPDGPADLLEVVVEQLEEEADIYSPGHDD